MDQRGDPSVRHLLFMERRALAQCEAMRAQLREIDAMIATIHRQIEVMIGEPVAFDPADGCFGLDHLCEFRVWSDGGLSPEPVSGSATVPAGSFGGFIAPN